MAADAFFHEKCQDREDNGTEYGAGKGREKFRHDDDHGIRGRNFTGFESKIRHLRVEHQSGTCHGTPSTEKDGRCSHDGPHFKGNQRRNEQHPDGSRNTDGRRQHDIQNPGNDDGARNHEKRNFGQRPHQRVHEMI